MFTWILLIIIIAALFGFINFDHIREWLIINTQKYLPEAKKYAKIAKTKIEEKAKDLKAEIEAKQEEAKKNNKKDDK